MARGVAAHGAWVHADLLTGYVSYTQVVPVSECRLDTTLTNQPHTCLSAVRQRVHSSAFCCFALMLSCAADSPHAAMTRL